MTFLSHLRFADDIVLVSSDIAELVAMLRELDEAVGLSMNLQKTKIMSTNNIQITLGNTNIQTVNEYIYLEHNIKLGKLNQTAEVTRRIGLSWAAFGRLNYILRDTKVLYKPQ